MHANMVDNHRRIRDAIEERQLSAAIDQHYRNCAEWLRRANAAALVGMYTLARNLYSQACDELATTPRRGDDLRAKVPALTGYWQYPAALTRWQDMLVEQGIDLPTAADAIVTDGSATLIFA